MSFILFLVSSEENHWMDIFAYIVCILSVSIYTNSVYFHFASNSRSRSETKKKKHDKPESFHFRYKRVHKKRLVEPNSCLITSLEYRARCHFHHFWLFYWFRLRQSYDSLIHISVDHRSRWRSLNRFYLLNFEVEDVYRTKTNVSESKSEFSS